MIESHKQGSTLDDEYIEARMPGNSPFPTWLTRKEVFHMRLEDVTNKAEEMQAVNWYIEVLSGSIDAAIRCLYAFAKSVEDFRCFDERRKKAWKKIGELRILKNSLSTRNRLFIENGFVGRQIEEALLEAKAIMSISYDYQAESATH